MEITITSQQIITIASILTALGVIYTYFNKAKKKLTEPVEKVNKRLTDLTNEVKKTNRDHEKRIEKLEERMGHSESDREKLHNINALTLTGLQALLGHDEHEIAEARKQIKDYMTKESA